MISLMVVTLNKFTDPQFQFARSQKPGIYIQATALLHSASALILRVLTNFPGNINALYANSHVDLPSRVKALQIED
jgi:hypothetical protein